MQLGAGTREKKPMVSCRQIPCQRGVVYASDKCDKEDLGLAAPVQLHRFRVDKLDLAGHACLRPH